MENSQGGDAMTSKILKNVIWAGMLAAMLSVSLLIPSVNAQQSATEALQKAEATSRGTGGYAISVQA